MLNLLHRYSVILFLLMISFGVFVACDLNTDGNQTEDIIPPPPPPPPPPEDPIFSNVETIELQYPVHNTVVSSSDNVSFRFDLPEEDDIEYLVLGIFDNSIDIVDNVISNKENWLAGSRTGLKGFSISGLDFDDFWQFDAVGGDFTTAAFHPYGTKTYYWAVWGFDDSYNLIASSPSWKVTISGRN